MTKTLRLFLMSALLMVSGMTMAENKTVVFDSNETKGANTNASGEDKVEKDGITISTTSGGLGATEYRFAKGGVTTFTSTIGNITKVEFTCTASGDTKYGPGNFTDATAGKYTFEDTAGTWTGDAASFSLTASGAQVRATKIVVTVGEGSGNTDPDPEPQPQTDLTGKGTLEEPYTVADIIQVTSALAANAKSSTDVAFKGKISSIKYTYSTQYGTATFNVSDDGQAANEFTCYGVYYLENKAWLEGNTQVKVGDEVIVYGKVTNYNGKTLETSNKEAYVYSLNGVTKNEGGQQQQEKDVTVAEALRVIEGLEDGKTTSDVYNVTGYIVEITDFDAATYGNATFTMADEKGGTQVLTVFRAKDMNNEKISNQEFIHVGDQVVVQGFLQKYVKNNVTTPELTSGKIMKVNGKDGAAIENVTRSSQQGKVYNLAGQQVKDGFRGMVIINGKKYIAK